MLGALNAGVSGIQQFQTKLGVIGNNIANSNTVGYKGARAEFEDTFSQNLNTSGNASAQVGSGVNTTAVRSLFTQGLVTRSESPEDLAISGEGFFVVKDAASGESFATRAGQFRLNPEGYLMNSDGLRVQGYNNPGKSNNGDLIINAEARPEGYEEGDYDGYKIEADGTIKVRLTSGKEYTRGQVLLQHFRDPAALNKEGNNLYSNFVAAGPLGGTSPQAGVPGTNGLGQIKAGSLEMSNVDLTSEFSSLITTQRGFQANARIITTADELLQEVVNLKR